MKRIALTRTGVAARAARVVNRRWILLPLALLVTAPTGCASGRGTSGAWMAGIMGVMIVGGVVLGRGWMHGGGAMHDSPAASTERFSPARLLEQRTLLELSDDQVTALEAQRDEVAAGQRTPQDAARAAYDLLRPVQRAAVAPVAPATSGHH